MTINPHQAWLLDHVVYRQGADFDLASLPASFRPIADQLTNLAPDARLAAWKGFLGGREDREEIVRALVDIDPEGSCPDPPTHEDGGDDWGPIQVGTIPPAEPFPLDVLPEPLARLVRAGVESIGCPPDFLAVPALVVAGGVIGRSVSLKLKEGYFASASAFAACVGPPSDGKTPGYKIATGPVRRIDESLEAEYGVIRAQWEEEQKLTGADVKRGAKAPQPPRPKRIDIDSATMEMIPRILADNPRGLIWLQDEMTALIQGLNQYKGGKGNDRSNVLKIWSGDAIKVDRVSHEANVPTRCPHPFLSIVGGMTPDMLASMADAKGRADGFIDRFLFTWPEYLPVPEWSTIGVPEDIANDWFGVVERLWARPMNAKEGRSVPHVAFFTLAGEAAWISHFNAHAAEMNAPGFPPSLRGPWGKLREYAGRLTLILACLDHAADPTADPFVTPKVGPFVIENAWRLVAYFKSHTRRVHANISQSPGSGDETAEALVAWLRQGQLLRFTEHEFKQDRRWVKVPDLDRAIKALTRRNVIRAIPPAPTGGRPSSPAYLVNPALLDP